MKGRTTSRRRRRNTTSVYFTIHSLVRRNYFFFFFLLLFAVERDFSNVLSKSCLPLFPRTVSLSTISIQRTLEYYAEKELLSSAEIIIEHGRRIGRPPLARGSRRLRKRRGGRYLSIAPAQKYIPSLFLELFSISVTSCIGAAKNKDNKKINK